MTAPLSPTVRSLTENVVPAISAGLGWIGDLNNPSFLLIIFTAHHDGIVIPSIIPAGIPSRTLKYTSTFRCPLTTISWALDTPIVTRTGSPSQTGIEIPFHIYWSLTNTLRKVSRISVLSGVVYNRCKQLWYIIPTPIWDFIPMISANTLAMLANWVSFTSLPDRGLSLSELFFSIFCTRCRFI